MTIAGYTEFYLLILLIVGYFAGRKLWIWKTQRELNATIEPSPAPKNPRNIRESDEFYFPGDGRFVSLEGLRAENEELKSSQRASRWERISCGAGFFLTRQR